MKTRCGAASLLAAAFLSACGGEPGSAGTPDPEHPGPEIPGPETPDNIDDARFVAVQISSLTDASRVRRVTLLSPRAGLVFMGGTSAAQADVWMVFDDGSTVHMTRDAGPGGSMTTRWEWDNHSIQFDEGSGEGVYSEPGGNQEVLQLSPLGSLSQAITLQELSQFTDDAAEYFMTGQHIPFVEELVASTQPVRDLYEKAKNLYSEYSERGSERLHELLAPGPMAESLPEQPEPVRLVEIVAEVYERADGGTPETSYLPEQVSTMASDSSELVDASWVPARVRCLKSYRSGPVMAAEQYSCVASEEACAAAGGDSFQAPEQDCEDWCDRLGNARPVELASYDEATEELLCYVSQCVREFAPEGSFEPLEGEAACDAGCPAPEYCTEAPPSDSDSCESHWAPLLFGHTWKVTEAIRNFYQEGDINIIEETEGHSDYIKDWTFEVTAEGRVRERYTIMSKNFSGMWEEIPSDSWELNPQFETDPVERYFSFNYDARYEDDFGASGTSPEYCSYYFGHLVSLDGGTLVVLRNDTNHVYSEGPLRMKLSPQ